GGRADWGGRQVVARSPSHPVTRSPGTGRPGNRETGRPGNQCYYLSHPEKRPPMALVAAEHDPSSRRRVFAVYVQHGVGGAFALLAATILFRDEPARVLKALGHSGLLLVLLFLVFATILALLKFKLT